jgi:tRNA pseudouridine38-40 synthase
VQADAFCHSMVRSLVGALTAIGEGRRDDQWLANLIKSTSRADDVPVAPAGGLTLIEVGYPAYDELVERSRQTRALRSLPVLDSKSQIVPAAPVENRGPRAES